MSASTIAIFSSIILLVAFIIGLKAYQDGLPFWRTFVMSILGFTGISLLILKLFV